MTTFRSVASSFLLSFVLVLSALRPVQASERKMKPLPSCEQIISVDADSEAAIADQARYRFLNEERSVYDLLEKDPEKNLAFQAPWIAMNAWQRLYSMIHTMGWREVPHPDKPHKKLTIYNFFTKAGQETNFRAIVDNYEAQARIVEVIRTSGTGDSAGRSTNVIVGPAGSGKTELIEVIQEGYNFFMMHNPDFYLYVVRFKNLDEIPALKKWLQDEFGTVENLVLPYPQFPLAIMPKAVQEKIIAIAAPRVRELTGGQEPRPFLKLSTPVDKIRDMILEHYYERNGRRTPTVNEELEILNHHVVFKPFVLAAPKIDGRDAEVNWRKLFFGENPGFILDPNNNNPFKIDYSGKVPSANGGALLLDELFRASKKMRDGMLGLIESNKINLEVGESPHLDIAAFAATNDESLIHVKGEGTSKAQLSRTRLNRMPWLVRPYSNVHVALLVNRSNVYAQKLGRPAADEQGDDARVHDIRPIDFDEVFPMREYGKKIEGPDRRFALYWGNGPDRIAIQPHALKYMGYVAALTRLSFSESEAKRKMPNASIVNSAVFRDGVARMKALNYEIGLKDAEWAELSRLSNLLGEGHFGMDMRHVSKNWLPLAISMARENDNTLTVRVMREAFQRLLDSEEEIVVPDNEARLKWEGFADRVIVDLIVPEMRKDVMRAWGSPQGNAHRIYVELIKEIRELSGGSQPSQRLLEIMEFYTLVNREPLVPANITDFLARQQMKMIDNGGKFVDEPHPGLMNAIQEYLSAMQAKTISLSMIQDTIAGVQVDSSSAQMRDAFREVMVHELGYTTDRAILDAIATVRDVIEKKKQLEQ